MEKTHIVINNIETGKNHKIAYSGTHEECIKWVNKRGFDYQILRNDKHLGYEIQY